MELSVFILLRYKVHFIKCSTASFSISDSSSSIYSYSSGISRTMIFLSAKATSNFCSSLFIYLYARAFFCTGRADGMFAAIPVDSFSGEAAAFVAAADEEEVHSLLSIQHEVNRCCCVDPCSIECRDGKVALVHYQWYLSAA